MNRELIANCAKGLAEKNLSIAVVESATAGRLAYEFSLTEQAGEVLKGGIVCYDMCLKESLLRVPQQLIEQFTPESAEVTQAITEGLVGLITADIYIGITGLTTSGGSETPEKPVGTVFFYALFGEFCLFQDRQVFKGSAEQVVEQAIAHVAVLLNRFLAKG